MATRCRAQDRGRSTAPNMIVTFERRPTRVGGLVHLEPLAGRDLVGAQHRSDLVVEDLRRGARERLAARRPRSASRYSASETPERRAPSKTSSALKAWMWIDGEPCADRTQHVEVVVAVEGRVDAALEADLGAPQRLGLRDAARDLLEVEEVGVAAQVQRERALRERAEPALERADVRVVDVAVRDPGDVVARRSRGAARRPRRRRPRRRGRARRTASRARPRRARGRARRPRSTSRTARRRASPARGRRGGGGSVPPETHASPRPKPSASWSWSTLVRSAGSSQRVGLRSRPRGRP